LEKNKDHKFAKKKRGDHWVPKVLKWAKTYCTGTSSTKQCRTPRTKGRSGEFSQKAPVKGGKKSKEEKEAGGAGTFTLITDKKVGTQGGRVPTEGKKSPKEDNIPKKKRERNGGNKEKPR